MESRGLARFEWNERTTMTMGGALVKPANSDVLAGWRRKSRRDPRNPVVSRLVDLASRPRCA
jgi:hypothetical protein